ncbi:hypothetical protein NCPPB3923_19000 [Burkholderia glumae]|nr:hypothetical protein NCPPB3923_19000 [Burkholderia glumae]
MGEQAIVFIRPCTELAIDGAGAGIDRLRHATSVESEKDAWKCSRFDGHRSVRLLVEIELLPRSSTELAVDDPRTGACGLRDAVTIEAQEDAGELHRLDRDRSVGLTMQAEFFVWTDAILAVDGARADIDGMGDPAAVHSQVNVGKARGCNRYDFIWHGDFSWFLV